ncbi:MAG TPA: glycosyltransferase family 1 protein [Clostridia bacterium]|nr:glycosyltransferase family 1 protein [Clostridia bacterium]
MRIGIDISQIVYQGTGVASYTRFLVESLVKVAPNEEFVLFGSSLRNRQPLNEFVKSLEVKNVQKKFSFLPPKLLEFLWNGVHVLPIEAFTGPLDVFHSSDWLEPPTRKAKRVTTIHDLAVFKHPETFIRRGGHDIVANQKRKLHFVKHYSDLVIAVSQTTKKDVVEILGIPERKVRVIYEAADPFYSPRSEKEIKAAKEKFGIEREYILSVGTREPRKNLDRLVMAFAEIAGTNKDLSLVIVGKYGWGTQNSKLESKVKILGFVEKEDLVGLYSGAKAFVYPSLYEGFGLPILEAMASGCPVITSDLGAMKEVADKAAILVEPEKAESIANAISQVVRNRKLQEELRLKGFKRAGEFSWEKAALQTLRAYHSLVE